MTMKFQLGVRRTDSDKCRCGKIVASNKWLSAAFNGSIEDECPSCHRIYSRMSGDMLSSGTSASPIENISEPTAVPMDSDRWTAEYSGSQLDSSYWHGTQSA